MFLQCSKFCLAKKNQQPMSRVNALARAIALALVIAVVPMSVATAQGSDDQRRDAIAAAMEKAGGNGKVLSVKPKETSGGKPGFQIKILSDGRVRTFDIPAGGGG